MTKQILLSVLLLKQPRFICVHVCVHVSGFSLTPIPQYFFIIRTENRDKLIKGETESTTLSVHPLAFIFHSFQFISILLAINSKVVPTTFPPVSEPQQNTKRYKGMTEFIGAWKSSHTFPE